MKPLLLENRHTSLQIISAVTVCRHAIRAIINTEYSIDSCIATSRIMSEVFARFGVASNTIPVQVIIGNPVASYYLLGKENDNPMTPDEIESLKEMGGYFISIGTKGEDLPNRFDGHVVVETVDDFGNVYLIDLSIDQASRPEKKIMAFPFVALLEAQLHKSDGVMFNTPDGGFIRYDYMRDISRFKDSPDWKKVPQHMVNTVISLIDGYCVNNKHKMPSKPPTSDRDKQ